MASKRKAVKKKSSTRPQKKRSAAKKSARKSAPRRATAKRPTAKPRRAAPKKKQTAARKPSAAPAFKIVAEPMSTGHDLTAKHAPVDDLTSSGDELVDMFMRYDRDRTGFISAGELARLLEALGQSPNDEEVVMVLDMVDTGRTGKVSFQDFKRWWTAR